MTPEALNQTAILHLEFSIITALEITCSGQLLLPKIYRRNDSLILCENVVTLHHMFFGISKIKDSTRCSRKTWSKGENSLLGNNYDAESQIGQFLSQSPASPAATNNENCLFAVAFFTHGGHRTTILLRSGARHIFDNLSSCRWLMLIFAESLVTYFWK
jgi:hypothetical protein